MADHTDTSGIDRSYFVEQRKGSLHVGYHPVIAAAVTLHRDIGGLRPPVKYEWDRYCIAVSCEPCGGAQSELIVFESRVAYGYVLGEEEAWMRTCSFRQEDKYLHVTAFDAYRFDLITWLAHRLKLAVAGTMPGMMRWHQRDGNESRGSGHFRTRALNV